MLHTRRSILGASIGAAALLASHDARAAGSLTAAIYPGAWEDAYRAVVVPALKANANVDVAFEALFAVDEIAKARAARGNPSFDVFLLDPGPRVSGIDYNLYEPFDAKRLKNADKVPASLVDKYGIAVAAQVVGIAYNPKKIPKPTGWKDLFKPEFASHLGLTGFQTTFGTMCLIEIAKAFGGSETDVDPAFCRDCQDLAEGRRRCHAGRAAGPVPAGSGRPDVYQHAGRSQRCSPAASISSSSCRTQAPRPS